MTGRTLKLPDYVQKLPGVELGMLTPERAEWLLEHNDVNRPLSVVQGRKIAEDIRNDAWIYDAEPICTSAVNGHLKDGQHRCWAVRETGTAVPALFAVIPDEAMQVKDSGKPRSFNDYLTILLGPGSHRNLASITRLLFIYRAGGLEPGQTFLAKPVGSNARLEQLFREDENQIRAGLAVADRVRKVSVNVSTSALGAAHVLFSGLDTGAADDFFAGLAMAGTYKPRYDGADDPVVRWHRKWAGQGRHNTLHQIVQLALTIKTWNAYRDATRLPKLTWPAGESFPVPR